MSWLKSKLPWGLSGKKEDAQPPSAPQATPQSPPPVPEEAKSESTPIPSSPSTPPADPATPDRASWGSSLLSLTSSLKFTSKSSAQPAQSSPTAADSSSSVPPAIDPDVLALSRAVHDASAVLTAPVLESIAQCQARQKALLQSVSLASLKFAENADWLKVSDVLAKASAYAAKMRALKAQMSSLTQRSKRLIQRTAQLEQRKRRADEKEKMITARPAPGVELAPDETTPIKPSPSSAGATQENKEAVQKQ